MRIIDKYIFKQISMATLLGILIFIVFWISPEILFRIIRQTMAGQITFAHAVELFFLEIPEILSKAIPVGLMLGSLFVFDRLSRDSELIVIRGVGVSLKRLLAPVAAISILASILCFITYNSLIPLSEKVMADLNGRDSSHFVYVHKDKDGSPSKILIIGNYNNGSMSDVKLLKLSKDNSLGVPAINEVLTSSVAKYNNGKWRFGNGLKYEISNDGVYKNVDKFDSTEVLSGISGQSAYKIMQNSVKKPSEMNLSQLWEHYNLLKKLEIDDELSYYKNKIHQRFAMPFSCLLFGLCGVVLGYGKPREKKFIGLIFGICLVFLYFIIMPFMDMLSEHRILLPVLSAWIPNILVLGTIIGFIKYRRL